MKSNKTALVLGAGAIGSFYGAILHRAGWQVSVVLRSEAEIVKQQGFTLDSPLGDLSWQPHAVYSSTDQVPDVSFDYVILSVKVVPSIDRVALLEPWVTAKTNIVLIQNGIDIEAPVAQAFPENPVISALAFIAVSRTAPGHIQHKAYGRLVLGQYNAEPSEALQEFAQALEAGGVSGRVADNIDKERWLKCVWNTPFNPVSVLANGADTQQMLTAPGGEELVRAMMAEVLAVAQAAGHELPSDVVDSNVEGTLAMPAYHNSMALDYLAQREIEVQAILGNVVAIARKLEVSVPHLATMWGVFSMRMTPSALAN